MDCKDSLTVNGKAVLHAGNANQMLNFTTRTLAATTDIVNILSFTVPANCMNDGDVIIVNALVDIATNNTYVNLYRRLSLFGSVVDSATASASINTGIAVWRRLLEMKLYRFRDILVINAANSYNDPAEFPGHFANGSYGGGFISTGNSPGIGVFNSVNGAGSWNSFNFSSPFNIGVGFQMSVASPDIYMNVLGASVRKM